MFCKPIFVDYYFLVVDDDVVFLLLLVVDVVGFFFVADGLMFFTNIVFIILYRFNLSIYEVINCSTDLSNLIFK